MINGLIAIFLAVFAFAGFQTFRLGAAKEELAKIKLETAQAVADAQAHAREVETKWADGTRKAAETYAKNLDDAKRSAAGARTELDGLRDILAAAPASAASSPTSRGVVAAGGPEYELLGNCAATLQAMAEAADRLEQKVIGLQDWAKSISTP